MTDSKHRKAKTPDPQPDEEAMGNAERRRGDGRGQDDPGEGVDPAHTKERPPRQSEGGDARTDDARSGARRRGGDSRVDAG